MVDTSRLTIVVKGVPVAGSADGYSASVPKIFLFGGNPYLYWSAVKVGASPNGHIGLNVTTRGIALAQESGGTHRLWASGSVGSALPAFSSASSEVLGLGSNAISNGAADGFDVQVVGSNIFLTAGIGGKGCADPGDPMYGCYRLQVRSSSTPLGTGIFNSSLVTSPTFPFNPNAYSKIFAVPGGTKTMMGAYYSPALNGSPQPSNAYSSTGVLRYATNPATYTVGTTDSTPLPVPTFAANYLSTIFPTIQRFVIQCSSSNPLPSASDGSCYSGVTRVCQNQGYENGGFLQDYASGAGHVACVRSGKSTLYFVNISALTALHSSCTITTMISNACASAINRYCQNAGFAGGYGPLEFVNPTVQLTCVKSTVATIILTNFTALSGQQPSCTQTSTQPSVCNTATSLLCRSMGYIGGFGIVEIAGSAAQIGCIKGSVVASRDERSAEQYASMDQDRWARGADKTVPSIRSATPTSSLS
ncbi:hypothetical protein [Sphingomonas sp. Root710]|uniref:hypothetical protein n=1 Tax=Sphingomonas sp. Root710 TaxID=1736594 RepID=UPI0012E3EB37|nr:hypothetical protein [Sphingomonas sp. Root710]